MFSSVSGFMPMANGAEEKTWSASFSASSHIKMWDDDDAGVMYDARTGDTHFLDPVAMELLRLLSLSPLSFKELSETLVSGSTMSGEHDGAALPISPSQVEEALKRLQECGLADCPHS